MPRVRFQLAGGSRAVLQSGSFQCTSRLKKGGDTFCLRNECPGSCVCKSCYHCRGHFCGALDRVQPLGTLIHFQIQHLQQHNLICAARWVGTSGHRKTQSQRLEISTRKRVTCKIISQSKTCFPKYCGASTREAPSTRDMARILVARFKQSSQVVLVQGVKCNDCGSLQILACKCMTQNQKCSVL